MTWSYSAHGAMRRCQRLLVFGRVMASHAARDADRREAYVVKQLRHLPAWQGSLVHEVSSSRFLADVRAGRRVDAATQYDHEQAEEDEPEAAADAAADGSFAAETA